MLSARLKGVSSSSKLSVINFDTLSSSHDKQLIFSHNNTNNNKIIFNDKQSTNTKSFDQTIDRAVEYFEQILAQCVTSSNTSLIHPSESKFESRKRDGEDILRSGNRKQNFKMKQRKQKISCRQWCEEQNRRLKKYNEYHSNNRSTRGFTFYCRKALLQKANGTTYICIRKRFD